MKRRNLRLTALLLVCAVLLGSVAMAAPEDWDYEFPTNWSHDAMVFAVENGILRGDQNHNLNAEQPITRAELAAVPARVCSTAFRRQRWILMRRSRVSRRSRCSAARSAL